jgi:hypothetical protein
MMHILAWLYILGHIQSRFGENLVKVIAIPDVSVWVYQESIELEYQDNPSPWFVLPGPKIVELEIFRYQFEDKLYWQGRLGKQDDVLVYSEITWQMS